MGTVSAGGSVRVRPTGEAEPSAWKRYQWCVPGVRPSASTFSATVGVGARGGRARGHHLGEGGIGGQLPGHADRRGRRGSEAGPEDRGVRGVQPGGHAAVPQRVDRVETRHRGARRHRRRSGDAGTCQQQPASVELHPARGPRARLLPTGTADDHATVHRSPPRPWFPPRSSPPEHCRSRRLPTTDRQVPPRHLRGRASDRRQRPAAVCHAGYRFDAARHQALGKEPA